MTLYRDKKEELLFHKLKQLIEDSDDQSFKKDVDYLLHDENIMGILRCKKMRTDCAFQSVKKIQHIVSSKYQDFFKKFHPEVLRNVLATPGFGPLRHRDEGGYHMLTVQIKHWKVSEYSLEDLICACVMLGFEMAKAIETQEKGVIFVLDIEGVSFSQAKQATPFFIRKTIDIIFNSLPLRVAGIHFINVSSMVEVPLTIAKNLFPLKLKKRVYFHSNLESLHGHIPHNILPQRFNGALPDEEAYDYDILNNLFTPEVLQWYDRMKSRAERKNK